LSSSLGPMNPTIYYPSSCSQLPKATCRRIWTRAHFGTPHFQNMSPFNRGPLWKWFRDLASALQYLHDNDIVHGDIKPKNILVSGNEVFICDFGSARYAKDISSRENGSILGITPKYSAPEVSTFTGNLLWSTKADVFSLGCVFAELITVYSGQSVKAFDNFRRVGLGCCAFHENIPGAYLWIDSLCVPEDICYACFYSASRSIKDMLIMDPARRPGAKDLMYQLRSACSTASLSQFWNSSGSWNDLASNSSQSSNFCNENLSSSGAGPLFLEKPGPGGAGSKVPKTSTLDISCPLFEYGQILTRLGSQVKLPGAIFNPGGESQDASAWESLFGGATSPDGMRYSAQNVAFGKEGFGFLYEIYGTVRDYLNPSRLSKRSLGNSKVRHTICSSY
jgi:serine/threonine protein kinase